ncbi:hypothetical protein [Merismopedia glauca]|uniref:Uncharacterized protein n=1 Tax=Merismopedia glauca CCAP 1448/3 TaxID=1296344 RepID=A0A2T1C8N6_9CYAN|nr:hypothetical protein [Merismopedia glauca]PSB04503.1 hypothetical protein C7B64_03535 [Merismopedia glauca CCAP 1448/3]
MVYYLLRSQSDGKYVVAYPETEIEGKNPQGYLLVFPEHFEALSYVNAHAPHLANRCGVESITPNQLKPLLQRWGYVGIGMVKDALLARIEFLTI